jgi:hypothetical protein
MLLRHAVPAVVLALLVVSAGTADRTGRLGAVALAALSLLWLRVNGPVEGFVLVQFSESRGVTGSDFAGVAGLALAAWRMWLSWPRRPEK